MRRACRAAATASGPAPGTPLPPPLPPPPSGCYSAGRWPSFPIYRRLNACTASYLDTPITTKKIYDVRDFFFWIFEFFFFFWAGKSVGSGQSDALLIDVNRYFDWFFFLAGKWFETDVRNAWNCQPWSVIHSFGWCCQHFTQKETILSLIIQK